MAIRKIQTLEKWTSKPEMRDILMEWYASPHHHGRRFTSRRTGTRLTTTSDTIWMNVRCWHLRIGEQTPPTRKHTMSLPVSSVRTLICPVTRSCQKCQRTVAMGLHGYRIGAGEYGRLGWHPDFLVGHHADKMVSTFVELVDKSLSGCANGCRTTRRKT